MIRSVPDSPVSSSIVVASIIQYGNAHLRENHPTRYHINTVISRFQQLGEFIMPSSRSTTVSGKGQFDVTFVNRRLNETEATQFTSWYSQTETELGKELAIFISRGHKISLSWDDKNTCFIASATCRDERNTNYNLCLSSRSDDWLEALMLNVFKSDVIFEGKAWVSETRSDNWG